MQQAWAGSALVWTRTRCTEPFIQTVVEMAEALEASRLVHLSPLLGENRDAFIQGKAFMEQRIQESRVPWSIVRSAPAFGPGDDLLDGIGTWMVRSPVIPRYHGTGAAATALDSATLPQPFSGPAKGCRK